MKKLTLALVVAVGFSASALAVKAVEEVKGSSVQELKDLSTADTPPEKPEGDEQPGGSNPPAKPGEGGEGGGTGETPPTKPGEGGGSDDTTTLTGVLQLDSGTESYDGGTLSSTTSDENVILVQSNACLTISNYTLNKSGGCSNTNSSNFFALNAVVAAKTAGKIYIDNSVLNSNADGANCLFASGSNSTIYAYTCTIASTEDSSRGLDATYGGTVIASKMYITTEGSHCAALATDRGNGYISATDSTLATKGQGSPLVYSTGCIEANCVTGSAAGAQIAGIEGLSTIRIRNSGLTGSAEKASESVPNGVIIYQSNSGDSTDGTATFEVSDSALTSTISDGAMFYITHSAAYITVKDTALDFDTDSNYLVLAAGNDGEHGWGNAGSNGAEVVFTAIDQTLVGNIAVDGISAVDLYLTNSTYTGTFEKDSTNAGDGDVNVFVSADSTWTVTESCTLKSLTAADGAQIKDGSGKTVSIVNASGTVVPGASDLTITVSDYISGTFATTNITAFEIDRTAFEAKYGTSQQGQGSTSKTYYIKPHAPENAVLKVRIKGEENTLTPDMDHKYWLDDYWDGENGVTVELIYDTDTGYFFIDGSGRITRELTITTNKLEIDPPAETETIKAQAKSGSTYYLTLKEAIDAGKKKITLNDNVTLEETLTVTNAITLNLNTNVVTLGSALTNAFRFTAGATVSNGTINSSLAANAEDSCLLRFTDCKATLKNLTISGRGYEYVVAHDSDKAPAKNYAMTCDGLVLTGNGCLLSVDYANATLTNDCSFTVDNALASFGEHEAAIYCTGNGTVSIVGGTYSAPTVLLSDDYGVFFKSDDVTIEPPAGYVWENGRLVEESAVETVTPGVASEPYDDALSATNAAAKINADKESCIIVPTSVEESSKATYLGKVEATVTGDNRVVITLTPEAAVDEQNLVDAAVTNETVFASLASTNATATIAPTTPGLYYWIEGGTDVCAVTNAGVGVLSTNGGSVELSKPTLDATKGRAFFRVAAGVSAPVQSNDD